MKNVFSTGRRLFWMPIHQLLMGVAITYIAASLLAQDSIQSRFERSLLQATNTGPDFKTNKLTDLVAKLRSQSSGSAHVKSAPSVVRSGQTEYAVVNVEFDNAAHCNELTVAGVYPISRFDRFVDLFVPMSEDGERAFKSISNQAGFVWAEIDATHIVPPAPRVEPQTVVTKEVPEPTALGGIDGFNGRGTVIAIIDSGIDFHHPDFIAKDSRGEPASRLLWFWDTTSDLAQRQNIGSPAPARYPNGTSIGSIFGRDDLTRDLRTGTPRLVDCDRSAHGTACASIAAGNGAAAKDTNGHPRHPGVAPQAEIIAVRISNSAEGRIENGYLMGAICDWLNQTVGSRPLVISCSFGGHRGGHDGCRVQERQLDARFPDGAVGRAICLAAGNEGGRPFHATAECISRQKPGRIAWNVSERSPLWVWIQANEPSDILIATEEQDDVDTRSIVCQENPFSHHLCYEMEISAGSGALLLASKSGRKLFVDAYLPPADGLEFSNECRSESRTVGSPATAQQPMTIGSYNWNDAFDYKGKTVSLPADDGGKPLPLKVGSLSSYSSRGYRRFGAIVKPEVVAPGQWFSAAAPLDRKQPNLIRDTAGYYQAFNGTSAATPYVAGVVALLLQKKPTATFGEIKQAICTSASKPPGVLEDFPNADWGYGKLDLKAVRKALNSITP